MDVQRDVKRAKKKDKEAFSRLIKAHEQMLYRVSFSILRSDIDCADAIQETILKCYNSIHRLREPAYFKTWLTRILMNECYRTLRNRKKVIPMEKVVESGKEDKNFELVEVEEAVQQLPEDLRMAIGLFYFEDLPIKEIAEVTDCPVGTVKNRLHRGRHELEKILGSKEERGSDL